MAVILTDGFDLYNGTGSNTGLQSQWFIQTNTNLFNYAMTTGRFGGQCFRGSNGGSAGGSRGIGVSRAIGTSLSSLSIGFAFKMDGSPATAFPICALFDSLNGQTQCHVAIESNGAISAYRGFVATALGNTAAGLFTYAVWHYIGIEYVVDASVGRITVSLDGAQVLNLTNINTKGGTLTTADTIFWNFGTNGGFGTNTYYIDDLYVTNTASFLGERRIETLRPASDSSVVFARSTGATNYTLVNETLVDGDTSYVQGTSVGDTDLYTIGSLSSTPSTIDAVNVISFAEKTDASTRTLYNTVTSGATSSDGSAFNLAASYQKFDRIITTDPNTSAAWTVSAVNALKIGPKVAS